MEEVFGEIRDETDDHEKDPVPQTDQTIFSMDGESELDDMKELLEGVDPEEIKEIRTIAGFIMERHGDIPKVKSVINVPMGKFIVEKMEGNKIVSVKFKRATVQHDLNII